MGKNEKRIKLGATALCELFTVYTMIRLLAGGEPDRLALAFGTLLLALLPMLLEKLLSCRLSLPLYLFALAYAIGPMLGHCWYFYYKTSWWDKLLHICGGVVFAVLGAYLGERMTGMGSAGKAVFAFCVSVTVAVLWEFAEFGADQFLGMDMQNDRLIDGLTSYLLGDRLGVTGHIEPIRSVAVNGKILPGYIDIGLIDTMLDMLLETVGAAAACLLLWLDRGKHPLIRREPDRI